MFLEFYITFETQEVIGLSDVKELKEGPSNTQAKYKLLFKKLNN